MVHRAQIYCGKIVRNFPIFLRLARTSSIQHGLRLNRLTHRAVAHHAGNDVRPLVGVVRRAHDAFQRVATGTIEQCGLFLFGAGDAHHPLGVCELTGKVLGLLELDVSRGGLLGLHERLGRGIDVVAYRADSDRIFAWDQPVLRKGVASLRVSCHAHPDD